MLGGGATQPRALIRKIPLTFRKCDETHYNPVTEPGNEYIEHAELYKLFQNNNQKKVMYITAECANVDYAEKSQLPASRLPSHAHIVHLQLIP